jgi:hypothetical protein
MFIHFEFEMEENEESSEEGFECVTCNDFPSIKLEKHCPICDSSLCDKCTQEGNIINFTEWLENCSNKCAKCKRIGCKECMKTCYQCWNKSDTYEFICEDCNGGQLRRQHCEYHSWWLCSKHRGKYCKQCEADENYCGRHSTWG